MCGQWGKSQVAKWRREAYGPQLGRCSVPSS